MMQKVPKFKSPKWQAERRRVEQFINARFLMFRTKCVAGNHVGADEIYEDLLQSMDELLQLAGAER